MASDLKSKFWVGICWLKSMRDDWKDQIDLVLQMPYVYCVHDKDLNYHGDLKDPHVHIMIAYANTTTEKHITSIFNEFSTVGNQCCNKVFRVKGVQYVYDYLIHDTALAKKQKKHLYDTKERIEGLGWDTSTFNQMQQTDRLACVIEIANEIETCGLSTYIDLDRHILHNFDLSYYEILISYSSHFDRLLKGQWQKMKNEKENNLGG